MDDTWQIKEIRIRCEKDEIKCYEDLYSIYLWDKDPEDEWHHFGVFIRRVKFVKNVCTPSDAFERFKRWAAVVPDDVTIDTYSKNTETDDFKHIEYKGKHHLPFLFRLWQHTYLDSVE